MIMSNIVERSLDVHLHRSLYCIDPGVQLRLIEVLHGLNVSFHALVVQWSQSGSMILYTCKRDTIYDGVRAPCADLSQQAETAAILALCTLDLKPSRITSTGVSNAIAK